MSVVVSQKPCGSWCCKYCILNVSDLREWESEAVEAYNVNRTPGIYLLDKEGRIMAKNLRGKELEMKIEGLLN